MDLRRFFICLVLSISSLSAGGENIPVRIRGEIRNIRTNEPVERVQLRREPKGEVVESDSLGRFSMVLPAGCHTFSLSRLSFADTRITVCTQADTTLIIQISPVEFAQREVVVTASRPVNAVSGLAAGNISLRMQQLESLPRFLGASDPMKILQLTPGVQTSGDGNAGIYVRGAEPGHNLVLLNDAPVYNPSHLLGFFSVFNSDHIQQVDLYKGHISPRYGGRLSSVLSVEAPDTLPLRFSVGGNVGIIASQLRFSVPMGQKQGLFLSLRKTYLGLVIKPLLSSQSSTAEASELFDYEFGDLNLTYVAEWSDRDKLILNGYFGSDHFTADDEQYQLSGTIKWQNVVGSLSWQHRFEGTSEMKHTFFTSHYSNRLENRQAGLHISLPSSIHDWGYKGDFSFWWKRMNGSVGLSYTYRQMLPQSPALALDNELLSRADDQRYYLHEPAVYLNTQWTLGRGFVLDAGVRFSGSIQTGPYTKVNYNSSGVAVDSVRYGRGKPVSRYGGIEPRIVLKYRLDSRSSLQFAYDRQRQYLHLVSISSVGLPTDFWMPSMQNIPPETGNNFSATYFRMFDKGEYECSVGVYYKTMDGLLEYNQTLFDFYNQRYRLDESVFKGSGRSYGLELMLKKNRGALTGWISYTLGRSDRRFPDIEGGRRFPARYDRRHDLSVVAAYRLNDRWDFSSTFVYATGNAFTMPVGLYIMNGNIIKEYGRYNSFRLPDYHRLDVSVNYWLVRNARRESGFNFSVYNAYKKNNPLYLFYVVKQTDLENNIVRVVKKQKKFYDIIPSVSWIFKF